MLWLCCAGILFFPGLESGAPLLDEDIHKVEVRVKREIRFFMVTEVLTPVRRV